MDSTSENLDHVLALKQLGILDTPCEDAYDNLTTLAADLCDTPIAVICFMDKSRVWLKSKVGIGVDELSFDPIFFTSTVETNSLLVVQDSNEDVRFSKSPLVTNSPFIRSYAGAPLVLHTGHRVGTLAVLDIKPRTFTDSQKSILYALGRQTVALMEARTEGLLESALKTIERQKIQLSEASKLSALGEMAAGVAHEINNPLGVIVARAGQLILHAASDSCSPEIVAASARGIENTGMKIAEIVRSILSIARRDTADTGEAIPLMAIYENVLEFSKERLDQAQVSLELTPPLPSISIKCNPMQISQVLLNLLFNAIDAVQELPIKWIKVETTLSSAGIEIEITDSGKGIPPSIQQNLMKPFFTTKPQGKGTGLGLAISEKILKAHGGSLDYDPTSAHTRFIARLPR